MSVRAIYLRITGESEKYAACIVRLKACLGCAHRKTADNFVTLCSFGSLGFQKFPSSRDFMEQLRDMDDTAV